MSKEDSFSMYIENLLVEGKLQEALKVLLLSTSEKEKTLSPLREEIILINARFSDVTNDFFNGLINYEDYSITKYRIVSSVLHIIGKENFSEKFNELEVENTQFVTPQSNISRCKIVPLIPKNITASITHNYEEIEKLQFIYISIPQDSYHRELYAFKIKGNSMNPIQEGMIVVANPIFRLYQFKAGERYIIITNEEAMFKRVLEYDKDSFLLVSDNQKYPKQIIDKKNLNMLLHCVNIFKEEDIQYTKQRGKVSSLWKDLQSYKFSK